MIDLRSDTQTRPSDGMRAAMASAVVGDEQRREDPTVCALEERVAAYLGQQDAVFVPSATMANQIALGLLAPRGSELIVEASAHIVISELGGAAFHSGLQVHPVRGENGRVSADALREAIRRGDPLHSPAATLLALENTHNAAGGAVWPHAQLRATVRIRPRARACGSPRRRTACPTPRSPPESRPPSSPRLRHRHAVSLERAWLPARRADRRLGGADGAGAHRQSTASAARCARPASSPRPGLYALEHNLERLADDHRRARRLGEAWAARGLPVALERIETNMVQLEFGAVGVSADRGDRGDSGAPVSG